MSNKYSFLGIKVHALTIDCLHVLISDAVNRKSKYLISHHNLHSLYIFHHEHRMREFYDQSDYVHIDGMLLVFLGRLLGFPLERQHRVTYADWIRPLMREAARQNWRVFFLGSEPEVAADAVRMLKEEVPGLQLNSMHGYFDVTTGGEENQRVLQNIKVFNPHILMVGMGMTRQEYWIMDNINSINANVILTAGACMDYVAKRIPTPPRWIGQLGLEGFYRLLCEPKRLWRRYLLEPLFILKILAREMMTRK